MVKNAKYLFFGFSFFLSLKSSIGNFFIILILVCFLIEFLKWDKKEINYKIILYSFAPIFLFCVISLFWSTNMDKGLKLSLKHMPLLLLPLAFSIISNNNTLIYRKYSFYGLLIGSVLISVILLSNITLEIISLNEFSMRRVFSSKFTSHKYTAPILNIHPSYLGIYTLLSIAILIFNKLKFNKYLKNFMLVVLISNILFLNARILFLLLAILFILKIILIKSLKVKLITIISLALIFCSSLFLLRDTYIYKKLIVGSIWEITHNVGTHNTTDEFTSDSRLARWKSAIEASKNNLIFGSGLGTEMNVLLPVYKKNNLKIAFERKFNTHNQYLYYLIIIGFVGLLLFLTLFIQNFILSIKNKDIIMFYFLIILFVICLVENVLYRNAGFTFIAVYTTLFNKKYLSK